jgi:hypothetical protein
MADERLPCFRCESISPTSSDTVTWRCRAISFIPSQNLSSMLTLVLWPARTIERLMTNDFMTFAKKAPTSRAEDFDTK